MPTEFSNVSRNFFVAQETVCQELEMLEALAEKLEHNYCLLLNNSIIHLKFAS